MPVNRLDEFTTVRSFNKAMQKRIKIKDVASYCMVSKTTVRRWIESGKLRAIRLPSGHYRINRWITGASLRTAKFRSGKAPLSPNLKERRKLKNGSTDLDGIFGIG